MPDRRFGAASARRRREADLFWADLLGRAPLSVPHGRTPEPLLRGEAEPVEAVAPGLCDEPAAVLDRFASDSAVLTAEMRAAVAQLARRIVDSQAGDGPVAAVCVIGHTDSSGSASHNRDLGARRAAAVEQELRRRIEALRPGLSAEVSFTTSSAGESAPAADNTTSQGKARNRRVEVRVGRRPPEGAQARAFPATPEEQGPPIESVAESGPPAPVVVPLGPEGREIVGTPGRLPLGAPAFSWAVLDPTKARASPITDSQANPNRVTVLGLRAGATTLRMTYRPASGAPSTFDLPLVVTRVSFEELRDPVGQVARGPNEVVRPIQRTAGQVAHRTAVVKFEPQSFWAGKSVEWSFTVAGVVRGALPAGHPSQLEAAPPFAFTPATRRSVLDAQGRAAVQVNLPPLSLNAGTLEAVSVDHRRARAQLEFAVPGVVVLDPGHGGTGNLPGSSSNNATSVSGVLEKNMTLQMVLLVRDALAARNRLLHVFLTRDDDFNVAGAARARVADCRAADVFLSIHWNGSNDPSIRGTSCFVRANSNGNVNRAEDLALAQRVQNATFPVIPGGRDRGVHDDTATAVGNLAVLNDANLGNTAALHPIRSCLLEVEFITNADVDQQFNVAAGAPTLRGRVASAIADALIDDLLHQP